MALIEPLDDLDDADLSEVYEVKMATLGFLPNSARTMARWPELAKAYGALSRAIASTRRISSELVELVFLVASSASGCRYCQAHAAHALVESGTSPTKLDAVWEFDSSDEFTDAERAALGLALAAGTAPPYVSAEHFAELRRHFPEDAIVELVGVIAFSGFMNRWNATVGTVLEEAPLKTAEKHLTPQGWSVGPHGSD